MERVTSDGITFYRGGFAILLPRLILRIQTRIPTVETTWLGCNPQPFLHIVTPDVESCVNIPEYERHKQYVKLP